MTLFELYEKVVEAAECWNLPLTSEYIAAYAENVIETYVSSEQIEKIMEAHNAYQQSDGGSYYYFYEVEKPLSEELI